MGGGSPIIRGFEANRVLLVVDGVRMNNAIYRSGHLQNAITLDNAVIDQMEVIYGPGSLTYGSDAIGGVVHFRTRDPKLLFGDSDQEYQMQSNFYSRFSSANLEKTLHYDLDYGNRNWGSLTSVSFSSFDDLRAGSVRPAAYPNLGKQPFAVFQTNREDFIQASDPDLQNGSGYNQIDILQKIRIQPSDKLYFVINGQYSTSSDVPRYDRLNDTLETADKLKYAEWYYGPQQRVLGSFKTRILNNTALFSDATLIASYQRVDEDRFSRRWDITSFRTWNSEDVSVYSLTADFNKDIGEKENHRISYGLDYSYNNVESWVALQNSKTDALSEARELTRYPSAGSQWQSSGGYLNYRLSNEAKTIFINAGVRYTDIRVWAKYDLADQQYISWPERYFTGIQNNNADISWAGGITWNSKDNWQVRALASKAFRAPNIDDLFKNRIKNDKAVLPNEDLKPETSLNAELTLGKTFGAINTEGKTGLKVSATAFYTILEDVIVRRDNGEQINGPNAEIFDVQENVNAREARVYGLSGNVVLGIGKKIKLESGYNYTRGETDFQVEAEDGSILLDTITPLDHIPPAYGRTALSYEGKKWKVQGVVRYNRPKPAEEYAVTEIKINSETNQIIEIDREGSSDNILETGTCTEVYRNGVWQNECGGSPGWITYNFYSSFKLGKSISLDFAVENILDIHYRNFGSGISAPGRNFIATFRAKF